VYEKTISVKSVYQGKLVDLELVDVELTDGRKSMREIVRHKGAVAILARRPDGKYIFVRQYRKAVEQEMFEVVAGNLNPGEDPEDCARRELKEETGFSAKSIRRLGFIYPSPGYVSEKIIIFFADVGEQSGATDWDEDEHLDVVLLDRDEILERIRGSEIHDSKTLAAWLLSEHVMKALGPGL
jgi:ADP-ribose pyrophosphatase